MLGSNLLKVCLWPRGGAAPPDTPTGLAVDHETYNSLKLNWNAVDGATGYKIYQDTVEIDDVADNSEYEVTGLDSATAYDFQVSAYNANGESDLCTAVEGTTLSSLTNGLVSYWTLNETSGTRNDTKGSNHLTDNNTVGYDTGKNGNAASFVAANSESLSVADGPTTAWGEDGNGVSVAFWIYATGVPIGFANMFGRATFDWVTNNNSYGLTYFSFFAGSGQIQTAGPAIPTNAWTLCVATYDPTDKKMRVSVNAGGQTASAAGANAALDASAQAWSIGANPAGTWFINGLIDEFGVWNRAISTTEITELYNSGAGKFYNGSDFV